MSSGRKRTADSGGARVAVVSFFNPADVPGGAERIAWAEAELLAGSREVAFVSASPPVGEAPFPQYRLGGWTRGLYRPAGEPRGAAVVAVFHLLSLFNPIVLVEAWRLFRRLRPAVVHTHNLLALSPAVWLAARLAGARVVHTHHDLWLLCERATMTDGRGQPCGESQPVCLVCKALRGPKRAQLAPVSREIVPSRWLGERLGRDVELVPNFATTFRPGASLSPGVDRRPPTAVYVGALTPHKLGPLLEAFDLAAAALPELRLAIAGAGPLGAGIAARAASNPRLECLGLLDPEARDRLLAEASAVVIPSTCAESSSLVFFEALAAGLPVVASDIGALTELARFGNVVLVEPGDAQALADALVGLLGSTERLEELRGAAIRHRDAASPERFTERLESVLDRVGGREAIEPG